MMQRILSILAGLLLAAGAFADVTGIISPPIAGTAGSVPASGVTPGALGTGVTLTSLSQLPPQNAGTVLGVLPKVSPASPSAQSTIPFWQQYFADAYWQSGDADDTAAINRACTAAYATMGYVMFSPRVYTVSSQLYLGDSTHTVREVCSFIGSGYNGDVGQSTTGGTVLNFTSALGSNAAIVLSYTAPPMIMRDIKIETQSATPIWVFQMEDYTVSNKQRSVILSNVWMDNPNGTGGMYIGQLRNAGVLDHLNISMGTNCTDGLVAAANNDWRWHNLDIGGCVGGPAVELTGAGTLTIEASNFFSSLNGLKVDSTAQDFQWFGGSVDRNLHDGVVLNGTSNATTTYAHIIEGVRFTANGNATNNTYADIKTINETAAVINDNQFYQGSTALTGGNYPNYTLNLTTSSNVMFCGNFVQTWVSGVTTTLTSNQFAMGNCQPISVAPVVEQSNTQNVGHSFLTASGGLGAQVYPCSGSDDWAIGLYTGGAKDTKLSASPTGCGSGSYINANTTYPLVIGAGTTATTPAAGAIAGQGGSGANVAGANFYVEGGASTGTANGGSVFIEYSPASGTSSSTANAEVNAVSISGTDGGVQVYNAGTAPTGGDKGAGTLNLSGPAFVNNAPLVQNVLDGGIPLINVPSAAFTSTTGTIVIGQNPTSSATVSLSATSGTGVTMTFSAATLLGTSADVGRILTVLDSGSVYRYATVTAFSSTTVATVTLNSTFSSTGPFANTSIWLTGSPTSNTTAYSVPLVAGSPTYAAAYVYLPANAYGASSAAGWYYATFQSATIGTVYTATYTSGTPAVVASPTALTSTVGTFTGNTTQVAGISYTLAGNVLGVNGELDLRNLISVSGNTNQKNWVWQYGGATIASGNTSASTTTASACDYSMWNRGVTSAQVSISGSACGIGAVSAGTLAVDSTTSHSVTFSVWPGTATDVTVIEAYSIKLTPGH